MQIDALWLLVLSLATPIAGVVGFAIQLRQVKKARLENEKLQLEIEALRKQAESSDHRVVKATAEEVLRFSSRHFPGAHSSGAIGPIAAAFVYSPAWLINLIAIIALFLLAYLLYDLWRLGVWLMSLI